MSSRGGFIGSGPQAGIYSPRPTPANMEDLNVYLNDEFLTLGGILNDVLEGGAFPPQSTLPKRVKESMMIYFTQRVKNEGFNSGGSTKEYIIDSPGLWLYKNKGWVKLIDDPESLTKNLTVYKRVLRTAPAPTRPPTDKYLEEDLDGWKYTPFPNHVDYQQYVSVAVNAHVGEDPIVTWNTPTPFNSTGDIGPPGADGQPGSGFYSILDNTVITWPGDATQRFTSSVGRPPEQEDVLTFTNTKDKPVLSRIYRRNSWIEPESLINGDMIATGTIVGDKIKAGTSIEAPIIKGGELVGGSVYVPNKTNPLFKVLPTGIMTATNGNFSGTVNATDGVFRNVVIEEDCVINGTISADNITGDLVSAKMFPLSSTSFTSSGWHTIGAFKVTNSSKKQANVSIPSIMYEGGMNAHNVVSTVTLNSRINKNGSQLVIGKGVTLRGVGSQSSGIIPTPQAVDSINPGASITYQIQLSLGGTASADKSVESISNALVPMYFINSDSFSPVKE